MSRPEDLSDEEVFLSKMGQSKKALKENVNGQPQPISNESVAKPEDFTIEEISLSEMGMSKRKLQDPTNSSKQV